VSTAPRRPRVVVLKFSATARDPRVLRQVQLLGRDADVVTVGYGPAPEGVVEHVEIPASATGWRRSRAWTFLLYLLRAHAWLYFRSPRVRFVRAALPAGSMDVVLANDALGVPLGLALRPRGGVHADLHEYAPRQGEDRLAWRVMIAPLMRWACRGVRGADSVSTVAPGIAGEYEREFGFGCVVVPNAPVFRGGISPTVPGVPLRLVHVGIAGRARRLEVMIDAVGLVERRWPGRVRFDLFLAPGDESYIAELGARADAVGAGSGGAGSGGAGAGAGGVVRVLAPVAFEEIVPTLAGYDVGVFVCPPTTFNLEHALPNKFFEFVQARLGVVIGPSPEMVAFVERFGFGVVAEGFGAQDMARVLEGLDAQAVVGLKAASDACARELSSEALSRPWVDAVARLAARAQGPAGPTRPAPHQEHP